MTFPYPHPQYEALKRYIGEVERAVGVREGETLIMAINRLRSLNDALTRKLVEQELEIAALRGDPQG